jgi:pimeloyl-ACP methyl ester carboxylesterase
MRIAPDLRVVGHSLGEAAQGGMKEFAHDLAALLDSLNIDQVVLCGLSMGGYIAFEMVRRYRQRLRGLILCNTRAETDSPDGRLARDHLIALVRESGREALAEHMLPKLLAPGSLETLPAVVEHVQAMMLRNHETGIIDALIAMKHRADASPLLGDIDVPTLVVAGEADQLIPMERARAMSAAIPDARFTLIPASGHLAPLEQPITTSRVLSGFLEGLE